MITLFKEITTEEKLQAIEKESEKWGGLYCDLDNKEERKFVKENSKDIEDIRKRLDTARIAKTKEYRKSVEAEAKSIDERLVKANAPFITLLDEYKEKRAKILAEQKAEQDAKDAFFERGIQHDEALLLNKVFDMELKEKIAEQKERDRKIAEEASAKAIEDKLLAEAAAKQAEIDKLAAIEVARLAGIKAEKDAVDARIKGSIERLEAVEQAKQDQIRLQEEKDACMERERIRIESNKKHVGAILKEIKERIMKDSGIDESTAKKVVNSIRKINRITITY